MLSKKDKFRNDRKFIENMQNRDMKKYNKQYREKYKNDKDYREKILEYNKKIYRDNKKHREKIKISHKKRYKEDGNYRKKVKEYNKQYNYKNKIELNKCSRKWRMNNKGKANKSNRKWRLLNLFGLTEEQYDLILIKQGGRCAICKKECTPKKRFAVDHNHMTKRVRGLLCDWCNRGLGLFKDDILRLESAIKYLKSEYEK